MNCRVLVNAKTGICDLGMQYVPHITVGKTSNIEELNKAYENIKDNRCRFVSVIDKISVEMIGENEESIRIIVFTFMRGIEHAKIKNYNRHANPKKCPLVNLAILLSLL